MGEAFFTEKLSPICITWLNDNIYSIREASINNLKSLTEIFGIPWAQKHAIPKLLSLHVETSYLHRLTPLFGMAALAPVMNADIIKRMFLPVLVTMAQDPVPNIRMNVAKTLQQMQPQIKHTGELEVSLI